VAQGTQRTMREIAGLEQRLREELSRADAADADARRRREELLAAEQRLGRARADTEELTRQLQENRSRSQACEGQLHDHAVRRARREDELMAAEAEIQEWRREGQRLREALSGEEREAQRLRDQVRSEQQLQQQEQRNAQVQGQKLAQFRAELSAAESMRTGLETEVRDLETRVADLEQRCAAHQVWTEEAHHKHSSSESALEKLRSELRALTAERNRLQLEVDESAREQSRLEVELQMALPALEELQRRCGCLEDRLADRTLELSHEADKVRRGRAEAAAAHARVHAMESHAGALGARLRQRQPSAGALPEPSAQPPPPAPLGSARGSSAPALAATWAPAAAAAAPLEPLAPRRPYLTPEPVAALPERPGWPADLSWGTAGGGQGSLWGIGGQLPEPALEPLPGGGSRPPDPISGCTWSRGAGGSSADAVRFLCEFVEREEARLGLTPRLPAPATALGGGLW